MFRCGRGSKIKIFFAVSLFFHLVIYPNVNFITRNNLQCVGGQIVNSLDESYRFYVCQTITNGVITILNFSNVLKKCVLSQYLFERKQ